MADLSQAEETKIMKRLASERQKPVMLRARQGATEREYVTVDIEGVEWKVSRPFEGTLPESIVNALEDQGELDSAFELRT